MLAKHARVFGMGNVQLVRVSVTHGVYKNAEVLVRVSFEVSVRDEVQLLPSVLPKRVHIRAPREVKLAFAQPPAALSYVHIQFIRVLCEPDPALCS